MAELGNTGKTEIDANLLSSLVATGVKDSDARELARMDAFGGCSVSAWCAGLKAAALLFGGSSVCVDWGVTPTPWDQVGPALASANGIGREKELANAIKPYPLEIQEALIGAIAALVSETRSKESRSQRINMSTSLDTNRSSAAEEIETYLAPIDKTFTRLILAMLNRKGPKEKNRKEAGEQLIEWLATNGKFVRTTDGRRYYLYRPKHQLFALNTDLWHAWLYRLTGVNPASTTFKYLVADCQTASFQGEQTEVCRMAYWDGSFLRVSRFDGTVYRLDGLSIEAEANGDGPILFDDNQGWVPYNPDFSGNGESLNWWLKLANFADNQDGYRLSLLAWLLSTFLTEICPTRPIAVFQGEAGSGKSMTWRILMRFLYGIVGEISGVPDRPDGFTASAANTHILVLDNLDNITDWLRDKLARVSTGSIDHYRQLYTSNELGTIRYRCWIAITARTPDTLRRDDLVDRILLLPVIRIEDDARQREGTFLMESLNRRNQWWGDVLLTLNRVVATIRRDGIPVSSIMRMADFESLGRTIAKAEGQEDIWERVVKDWNNQQADFLLQDSAVADALDLWLQTPTNIWRSVTTRTLYSELESALFGSSRPDASWPRSSRSFGRVLAGLRRSLSSRFNVEWQEVSNHTYYRFGPKS